MIERIILAAIVLTCVLGLTPIWDEIVMDFAGRKDDISVLFFITVGTIVASFIGSGIIMILVN
jgi:hypothetical protein